MPHDASFLAKCEQFLLHPQVRALSLAQRVDFLENKGLSPEEITACLKKVEQQNGLSRMLLSSATEDSLTAISSFSLWTLVKGYGVATAATLLLAYGYVRLRQKMIVQLVLARRQAAIKRREQRRMNVIEAMRCVADQRKQYVEVLTRVKNRVTRLELLQSTQASDEVSTVSAEHKMREREVRALQEQVLTLKQAVLEKYKHNLSQQAKDQNDTLHPELPATKEHHEKASVPLIVS